MTTNRQSQIASADPDDPTDSLLVRFQTAFAERENQIRRQRMMAASRAKARNGHAVRRAPTGYVADRAGRWSMDPDPRVREGITRLFKDFERLGSIGKVVRYYHENGILLPVRNSYLVHWTQPSRRRIRAILTHPAFKGDYVFGRRVTVEGRTGRRANAEEVIVVPNHHQGYIAPERWEHIQTLLCRPSRTRR